MCVSLCLNVPKPTHTNTCLCVGKQIHVCARARARAHTHAHTHILNKGFKPRMLKEENQDFKPNSILSYSSLGSKIC